MSDTSPRPARKRPLFLADSDDDDAPADAARPPPPGALQLVDDLFADDDFTFDALPPAPDAAALARDAEARHARAAPATPLAVLPSSSPPRDAGAAKDAGDGGPAAKKPRRAVAHLNEGLLLGPRGFPQLIRDTAHFRPRGKGHEAADLSRLLGVYQVWAHRLYPKTQFRETVARVERLAHKRRMQVALGVWHDEAHGRTRTGGSGDVIDLTEDAADPDADADADGEADPRTHSSAPGSDAAAYASSSSAAPSRPPSSEPDADDDDFDIDAVIREEEARVAAAAAAAASGAGAGSGVGSAPAPVSVDAAMVLDDDDDLWRELDAVAAGASAPPPPPPPPPPAPARAADDDADDDMWDIVRELEGGAPPGGAAAAKAPSPKPQSPKAPAATGAVDDEEIDWDDLYLQV